MKRYYVYIRQTTDIPRFEEVAGKVADAPNWEACSLGLHVEVDLSADDLRQLESLASVAVFKTKQHVLTEADRAIHDRLGWSKRASDKSPKGPDW